MSCVSIRVPQHRSLSRVPGPRSWLGLGGRPLDLASREPSAPALVSHLASQLVWCLRRKAGARSGKSANRLAANMLPRPGASAQHGISGSSLRGRLLCCPSQFSKQFFFPFLNVSL